MANLTEALSVSGLHVRYDNREVLRGLNLRLAAGEIYGLLGPNGAGKTTLIRTICGRIRPSGGSITVAGKSVGRDSRHRIGLVPQEIALYSHLTARENLEIFGRLSGLDRSSNKAAIAWVSEAANLTECLNERVDILSGGWKRRINIAAAILHRPALLILDEPTVGVDVDARYGLHNLILQLAHSGMGVLLATHDLEQAETLCTTVGFLWEGFVAPQGNPRALVDAAFGGKKEIILDLRETPSLLQSAVLQDAGFALSEAGLNWTKLDHVSDCSINELSASLQQVGMAAREIRFREPGLDSMFRFLSLNGQKIIEGSTS